MDRELQQHLHLVRIQMPGHVHSSGMSSKERGLGIVTVPNESLEGVSKVSSMASSSVRCSVSESDSLDGYRIAD
jgi:hypothetical protein